MAIIEAIGLSRVFKQAIKEPGIKGALKHLVTQKYKEKKAVDRIDLSIEQGESVAYVGPNGAGKSTTIKMLSGILVPTSGTIRVNGIVPHEERIRNAGNIGVVFGQRTQLWWDLPVRESFSLLKDIYEIPSIQFESTMKRFNDLLELEEFTHLPARKISLGQRMRADLAAALLHNPPIVFLDEPTIGLDIAVKSRIREFIKQLNKEQGTTILLTTHDLDDIKDLCSRMVIIDKGKLLYDGELQTITDAFAKERTIHFQVAEASPLVAEAIRQLPDAELEKEAGHTFSVRFDRFRMSAGEVAAAVMRVAEVVDFRIDEPSVEHIIRQVYDGHLELPQASKEALR